MLPKEILQKLKEHGRYRVVNPEKLESEIANFNNKDDSLYSISVLPSSELNKSFDDEAGPSNQDPRAQSLDKELQNEINQE